MPRLLLFAPCERVILGQGDNSASLIVVIQQMQFQGSIKEGEDIPKDIGAFARFAIFSQWYKTEKDNEKTFEQRVTLSFEVGVPSLDVVAEIQMTQRLHRMITNIPVLPLLKKGEHNLRIFLREKGEKSWGQALADYPIEITYVTSMQPQVQ
jgi:hypothetical protein